MKALFMVILGTSILMADVSAQTRKPDKNIEAVVASVGDLAKLVSNKNERVQETVTTNENSSTTAKNSKLKPGDIAPDAKYIDADKLYPFNNGVAVVMKGNASALIDATGNFIIPYNKYKIDPGSINLNIADVRKSFPNIVIANGLFGINAGNSGYMNAKGQFIDEPSASRNGLSSDKKYIQYYKGGKYIYVDADKNRFVVDQEMTNLSEGFAVIKVQKPGVAPGIMQKKYKSLRTSKFISDKAYDYADLFSEGMACVGKNDEFGYLKYGFIDTTGKEVIALQYSIKPSNFSSGFARVEPKENSQFRSAFINKQGEIVIKIGGGPQFKKFTQGYAFASTDVMEPSGKTLSQVDFLKKFGITAPPKEWIKIIQNDQEGKIEDGKFRIERSSKTMADKNIQGFIDLKTSKVVDCVFNKYPQLYFDPKAKLSFASVILSVDNAGRYQLREGYINEDGIFVIVVNAASKW